MKALLTMLGVCLCTAAFLLVSEALPTDHRIQVRRTRLCGRHLVEALALVCDSEYYEPQPLRKRKNMIKMPWKSLMEVPEGVGFLDRKRALSFYRNDDFFERRTRGIADECCKKSCTIRELASYCKHSIFYDDDTNEKK
ncbi:bombyxin A-2 homolog [Centruroides vittatus]|uniref:bombyxin A-2 homolog n=1 Tax=Centruroides sculpturatus TaxID=218467 RepID=UPI000C6E2378|nr:bombyxin A-2 homolog [Centruroides sculpturatus]